MLFNSIDFVLFLPIVIIGYFLLNAKYRWVLLLSASYYFYASWKLEYIVLILFSTGVDYFCGLQMQKRENKKQKRPFLILSILSNLGLLFGFKYWNFFTESANDLLSSLDIVTNIPLFNVLLPVGISFYTFQTLSYSIDVYKGEQKAERHLGYFALYVSFFPQLVAGPIERYSKLAPQLKAKHSFDYENLKNGLRLILFGLFTKMVVADNLAPFVDEIYAHSELYNSSSILLGMVFYSFQIYCDFFGYSLIAIGSALIMGIRLMNNFNSPYLSRNIADFWQRWHISLSTWFRDYLFFPMGGSRSKTFRRIFNIFTVFIVSGLWHGANYTFLFWGLIFALAYLLEKGLNRMLKPKKVKAFSVVHILLALKTFTIVTLAWVFFRSPSIGDAFTLLGDLLGNFSVDNFVNISTLSLCVFGSFILIDLLLFNKRYDSWIGKQHFAIRWASYFALLFAIISFSGVEEIPFIYFQF
ncbi:MAG: MBOAT family protein [Fluviicola sp.]|nr:MBOAT family protein [Fluviicola sp.]